MPTLDKQGQVIADPWVYLLKSKSNYQDYPRFSIVPLSGLSDQKQWPLPQVWIGAWFELDFDEAQLRTHILDLPLLSIHVRDFSDGRVFSLARRLRSLMEFRGELRVSGEFLIDQMALLRACGVDSFCLPNDSDLEHARFILQHATENAL